MPTVRKYGERQVDPRPLPSARRTAAATPASEGAGLARAQGERARASGDMGAAIANVGERALRIGASQYARIQEEEHQASNETALLKVNNQIADWKNKRLFDPDTGAFTLQGEAALPLPEQLRTEYDQLVGQLETGLSNDAQRAAFARLASQEWQGMDLQVRRHVFGEVQAFRAGELKSFVENASNAAIQNATDPKMVAVELHKAVSAIKTNGPKAGLGPEAIDAQVRAVRSQTHVGVISTLLAHEKDQQAAAYFDAAKSEIDGDKQDAVIKALDEGTLRGQSQRTADAILRAGGTLSEQRARAKAIEDPKLRDQVEQRIEHEAVVRDRVEREQEQAAMRTGYDILDRTPDVTRIPPSLWTSYDGGTRSAMLHYAAARAKGTPVETDLPTYYSLMQKAGDDPGGFVTENLLKYRGKLDDVEFKQLAGLQLSIKNGNRTAVDKDLAPFQTRSQLLDSTLALHGIDPNAKPNTDEGRAIAQLRRMVDKRVEFLQDAGKKASNQDIQSEIDALLSQSVTVPGSWWNIFPGGKSFTDTKRRLLDLTIADVPAADRAQIEAALRSRNRPVSDATVLDLYLENQIRRRR